MKNAVYYKDCWLVRGSTAYGLYEAKEWKKLDAHMKELDEKQRKLGDVPYKPVDSLNSNG